MPAIIFSVLCAATRPPESDASFLPGGRRGRETAPSPWPTAVAVPHRSRRWQWRRSSRCRPRQLLPGGPSGCDTRQGWLVRLTRRRTRSGDRHQVRNASTSRSVTISYGCTENVTCCPSIWSAASLCSNRLVRHASDSAKPVESVTAPRRR